METNKSYDRQIRAHTLKLRLILSKYKGVLYCIIGVAVVNIATSPYSSGTAPRSKEVLSIEIPDPSFRGTDTRQASIVPTLTAQDSENEGSHFISPPENNLITADSILPNPNNAYDEVTIPNNNILESVNAEQPPALPEPNQQTDPLLEMAEQTQQGAEYAPPPIEVAVNDNALPMPEPYPQGNGDAAALSITSDPNQQGSEHVGLQSGGVQRSAEDLRYLTLGSSVTWGAGMDVRYFAYPYLLSEDRTHISNLAVRAAGPKYPSVCIQSMVTEEAMSAEGSEDYDVIVLEYYMRGYDGLYDLAQRLRRRYPDAIIILLRLWQPVHITYYENNEMKGNLQEWAIPKKLFLESNTIAQVLKNTKVDLRWPDPTGPNAIQNEVVKDFGAHLFEIEKPRDPREAISKYRNRYAQDFNHMSEKGHKHVAEEIKKIVERELPSYPEEPRRGDWGDGDSCHSWYQSGEINLQYSLSSLIEHYDPHNGKFALSTGPDNPAGRGWVIVENPFDTPRNLILSYLATGPPPSIYPKTEIIVYPEHDESKILSRMVLNPVTTDYEHRVHIVLTTKVSVVMPGRSVVKWIPLENTGKPFRLTATAVVGRDVEEGGIMGAIKDFTFFG